MQDIITQITTLDDVRAFTSQLFKEGTNVHPDEDFNNYISLDNGRNTYSPEEALLRNRLMSESFLICEKFDEDIYNIMQEAFLIESGLDSYIPLPSYKN